MNNLIVVIFLKESAISIMKWRKGFSYQYNIQLKSDLVNILRKMDIFSKRLRKASFGGLLGIFMLSLIFLSNCYLIFINQQSIDNTEFNSKINSQINKNTIANSDLLKLWTYTTGAIYSSPVLSDIDGDGKIEVVFGSADHIIYALNGEDGSLLWNYTTKGRVLSSAAIGDIDSDGKLEIVIGSTDDRVYALNGEDGSLLWNYTAKEDIDSSPALADIDSDGKLEVVIGSEDFNVYALNGEDGSLLWNYTTKDQIMASPSIGDINNDGKLDVVIGSFDHKIYALNGDNGSLLWTYTTKSLVRTSAVLGDINNDNKLEVVFGSEDHNIYALNGEDGSRLWNYTLKMWGTPFDSLALGDVNGDSRLDVVATPYNVKLCVTSGDFYDALVFNGTDGSVLWGKALPDMGITSSPVLSDIDGDNRLEIIIGSSSKIIVVNGEDGSILIDYLLAWRIVATPSVGDIDNDGNLEIIVTSFDNNTYAFKFAEEHNTGYRIYWNSMGGLPTNTRNIVDIDPDKDMLSNYSETIIGTNLTKADTDGDGLPDGWEVNYGLNPLNSNDAEEDKDNDGLSNKEEFKYRIDPTKADTDGDGLSDIWEISNGFDPRDPNDKLIGWIIYLRFLIIGSVIGITTVIVFGFYYRRIKTKS